MTASARSFIITGRMGGTSISGYGTKRECQLRLGAAVPDVEAGDGDTKKPDTAGRREAGSQQFQTDAFQIGVRADQFGARAAAGDLVKVGVFNFDNDRSAG